MMTADQIYEFDLNGFLILSGILSSAEVEHIAQHTSDCTIANLSGKFSFLDKDPVFLDLMAHPEILNILATMLGDHFRFDHAFGISMKKDSPIIENLHAGLLEEQRSFWYHWVPGRGMHNGLIKVLFALNDVKSGDGGFICVPGSHKANMIHRLGPDSHLIINPMLRAGDVLVFTEALVHGSKQWRGDTERRALIYSYAPGFLSWKQYESVKPYLELATTSVQRGLLRPPYVGNYDEKALLPSGQWPMDRRERVELPLK